MLTEDDVTLVLTLLAACVDTVHGGGGRVVGTVAAAPGARLVRLLCGPVRPVDVIAQQHAVAPEPVTLERRVAQTQPVVGAVRRHTTHMTSQIEHGPRRRRKLSR